MRSPEPTVVSTMVKGRPTLIDATVASYRLTERLGINRVYETYRGEHTDTGTLAVVQLINPMLGAAISSQQLAQAEQAGDLDHPCAVPLFDSGWSASAGAHYVVRDFVEGQSLRRYLRATTPTSDFLAGLLHGVAGLLELAHEAGIVHGNLNPATIFVSNQPNGDPTQRQIKVLDLGLIPPTAPFGTPPYAAPEQACGAEDLDHRVDIYALGVIAYRLLSGRLPFIGVDEAEVVTRQLNTAPPLLTSLGVALPDGVERAVMRAIELEPEARQETVAGLTRTFPSRLPPPLPTRSGAARDSGEAPTASVEREPGRSSLGTIISLLAALAAIGYLATRETRPAGVEGTRASVAPAVVDAAASSVGSPDGSLGAASSVDARVDSATAPTARSSGPARSRARVARQRAAAPRPRRSVKTETPAPPRPQLQAAAEEPGPGADKPRASAPPEVKVPTLAKPLAARPSPKIPKMMARALDAGDYRKAYWLAKAHLNERPGHHQALVILGLSACALGRGPAAREAYSSLRGRARAKVALACKRKGVALKASD